VGTKPPGKGAGEPLRRSAEARLARAAATPESPATSPEGLLHELQVHQVELELQNEELRRTQGELELAHARYVALYDFAPVGYFSLDERGCLSSINLMGAAMLGGEPARLEGRPFSRFVTAQDLPRWERQQRQSRLPGGSLSCELRLERCDGVPFPAQLVCGDAGDGATGLVGIRWALIDITERRAAEEERERRLAELQRLNTQLKQAQGYLLQADKLAAIGQLAAGMAHEVNNPITYIKSNVSMTEERATEVLDALQESCRCEEACGSDCLASQGLRRLRETFDLDSARRDLKEMVEESLGGLDRIAKLVRDLRDFALPDSGRLETVELRSILERALRLIEATRPGTTHFVRAYGADAVRLRCRPSQLDQVFMNLMLNAIQAGRPGVTLTVRTGGSGSEGWAEIEDDGPGIPAENLPRIFEPFFSTRPIGEGTGLGLSVAHGIVHGHGGRIEVKSRVGVGTTFRVVLPLDGPPIVATAAPLPIPPGSGRFIH
jgi:PAS domain S-box-containing protein